MLIDNESQAAPQYREIIRIELLNVIVEPHFGRAQAIYAAPHALLPKNACGIPPPQKGKCFVEKGPQRALAQKFLSVGIDQVGDCGSDYRRDSSKAQGIKDLKAA